MPDIERIPERLMIYICPKCGRKEFSALAIRPGHGWQGKRCGGEVLPVEYIRAR